MLLTQIEHAQGFERQIGLEVQIESAKGLHVAARDREASPRLQALIFGPGDYSATMQMPVANIGSSTRTIISTRAPVARGDARGSSPPRAPTASRDRRPVCRLPGHVGLERSARIARVMGFDGKQCIHPSQIPVCHRIFSPSPDEVAHAKSVVEAYDEAAKAARGAIGKDGKMIDYANIRMARALLNKFAMQDSK
jgi:citrate lyase beta subunit